MNNNLKVILAAMAAIAISTPAIAGEAAKQIEGPIGAKIIASGPSADPGFTAILAEKDGKRRLFYETVDGKHLLYGLLFDANGNTLTAIDTAILEARFGKQPQIKIEQPTPTVQGTPDIDAAYRIASKARSVTEGKGKPVYIVFDPNCPFCKQLYRKTRGLAGHEIHWIPVGVLSDNSSAKAYALLNGGMKMADLEGGLVNPPPVTQDQEMTLTAGVSAMLAAKTTSVPMVLFEQDGKKKVINGLPNDNEITQIFGKK